MLYNCYKNIFLALKFLVVIKSKIIRFITRNIQSKLIISKIGIIKSSLYSFNAI